MTDMADRIAEVLRNDIMRQAPDLALTSIEIDCTVLAEQIAEALQPDVDVVAKTMFEDTHGFPSWHELSEDDQGLYRALACAALRSVGMEIHIGEATT